MFKKITVAIIMALSLLLLASCSKDENSVQHPAFNGGMLTIEEYMSSLSDERTEHLKSQTDLLLHPLKDAIELYGDDYELSWEGNYVKLKYAKAKCSFEAYVGAEFENYDWHNNHIDFDDCDVMEYLSFAVIEKVIFDGDGITLTDDISIGMSAYQISEKLGVDSVDYKDACTMIMPGYDKDGNKIDLYYTEGKISNLDYTVVFSENTLSRVEIANYSRYLTDKADDDNGKQLITEAFSFLSKNNLASFNADELSYKGEIYSPYYDSWFYGWQFTKGDFENYVINVEQNAPNRIYIAPTAESHPILFWSNGKYVDPMLSFLGKWRDYNSKEYIDIKSISKEGIVVFDMYVEAGFNTGEMVLLKSLNTAINDIPESLYDYLRYEYNDEALDGDIQLYDGNVQSGFYTYDSQKFYLIDSLFMDLNGSVQYLPRSIGDRVGAGPLPIHIPNKNVQYDQESTFGYMENFGRDDPNGDNTITNNNPSGDAVINQYLNEWYKTSDLKYADIDYRYLHDYVFPVNNVTYNVWQSNDTESPHYLYVDSTNELIIKETQFNAISRHSKELIYKSNTVVDSKSYANQKYGSLDGKIIVDLENRTITKEDSFVKEIELPEIILDAVGENERFMFFVNVGDRFALNGYVLFDHTTWGATLHITDSNVPNFDIGVYYLDSETFFLDPTIEVVGIPKDDENDELLDDKANESGKETRLVIREFSGKIIGYIYVDEQGKKTVRDYYGKILGYYYPDRDVTTNFTGKIIARGDIASSLLFTE